MICKNDSEKARQTGLSRQSVWQKRANAERERPFRYPESGDTKQREQLLKRKGLPKWNKSLSAHSIAVSGLIETTSCIGKKAKHSDKHQNRFIELQNIPVIWSFQNDNVLGSQQERIVSDQYIQYWCGYKQERKPSTVVQAIPGLFFLICKTLIFFQKPGNETNPLKHKPKN